MGEFSRLLREGTASIEDLVKAVEAAEGDPVAFRKALNRLRRATREFHAALGLEEDEPHGACRRIVDIGR